MTGIRAFALIASACMAIASAADAQRTGLMPGQWEIVTTIESMEMPGAPPGMANMMKGHPTTIRHCLTPEEAARGPQDIMKAGKACSFTHYSMVGGRLSSQMVCKMGGGTMTATSTGSFTPTGFTTRGRSVMTGGHAMTMTASGVGRRIGDCKK